MKPLLTLLALCSFHFLHAQTAAERRCAAFGKGQNLSNWLEASWQAGWPTANGYTKSDLLKMKEAGTASIRLPVVFAKVVDTLPPYNVDENHPVFQRIDSVIRWCDELQLNLIIDNHHEWPLTNQNWRDHLYRFGHLWSVLANRYKNLDPEHYIFELLNEPAIGIELDTLNTLFLVAIDSIRQHTAQHSVVVSPNFGSATVAYSIYQPLPDTNLIYTFHCYDPLSFTHQGFAWGNPTFPAGQVFPDGNNVFEPILYQGWTVITNWKAQHHKPLFLGEFGVSRHADSLSRCRWIDFIGQQLQALDLPWFYWDWRYDFSIFSGSEPAADSAAPCVSRALRLYGDSTYNGLSAPRGGELFRLYPSMLLPGESCHLQTAQQAHYTLTLLDALGRQLSATSFFGTSAAMPAPSTPGIYFVRLACDHRATSQKIIVR